MATRHAIATMDADARNRMRLASGRLVKRLGIPEPQPAVYERNPEIRAIRELEAHATFLESLDEALKAEGFSAAPGTETAPANLGAMTRAELNALALERGIDKPESHPNKSALIEAIEGTYERTDMNDPRQSQPMNPDDDTTNDVSAPFPDDIGAEVTPDGTPVVVTEDEPDDSADEKA